MTKAERLSRAAIVAAVPFAILLLRIALRGQMQWVWLVETAIHATYLALFASLPAPNRLWNRLPGAHRVVLGTIVVLLLCGQMFQQSRVYFPLVHWGMYCPPAPRIETGATYVDALGVNLAGEPVDVDLVELFPVARNGFGSRVYLLLRDMQTAKDETSKQRLRESADRLLAALRQKHNELHPENPVRTIRLVHYQLPVRWQGERPDPVEVFSYP